MKVDRRRHGRRRLQLFGFALHVALQKVGYRSIVSFILIPSVVLGSLRALLNRPSKVNPTFFPPHHATLTHSTCRELPVLHPCPAPSECSVTHRPPRKKAYWCRHSLCGCLLRPVSFCSLHIEPPDFFFD